MVLAAEPVEKIVLTLALVLLSRIFQPQSCTPGMKRRREHNFSQCGELCAVWRSCRWRCCGPFVSVADVSGVVVSVTWCGTRYLAELNYHAGAKYPVDCARWVPRRVPHAIRHVCDKGLADGTLRSACHRC